MAKGYNRFPAAGGGGGGMMQQLKKLQEQMEQAQSQLADLSVTASVGGGSVKVTMTGDQKCKSVEISPDVLKDADPEMLQDLILSAVNQALEQSEKLKEEKMSPFLGGIPGMGL
jgi:DNA-binding YbaB/EbfC family protein